MSRDILNEVLPFLFSPLPLPPLLPYPIWKTDVSLCHVPAGCVLIPLGTRRLSLHDSDLHTRGVGSSVLIVVDGSTFLTIPITSLLLLLLRHSVHGVRSLLHDTVAHIHVTHLSCHHLHAVSLYPLIRLIGIVVRCHACLSRSRSVARHVPLILRSLLGVLVLVLVAGHRVWLTHLLLPSHVLLLLGILLLLLLQLLLWHLAVIAVAGVAVSASVLAVVTPIHSASWRLVAVIVVVIAAASAIVSLWTSVASRVLAPDVSLALALTSLHVVGPSGRVASEASVITRREPIRDRLRIVEIQLY